MREILVAGGLPGLSGRAQAHARDRQRQQRSHSFTSTWMVLDPLTALSPAGISISAMVAPRGFVALVPGGRARVKIIATEAGGAARSRPSTVNVLSARHTRRKALALECNPFSSVRDRKSTRLNSSHMSSAYA